MQTGDSNDEKQSFSACSYEMPSQFWSRVQRKIRDTRLCIEMLECFSNSEYFMSRVYIFHNITAIVIAITITETIYSSIYVYTYLMITLIRYLMVLVHTESSLIGVVNAINVPPKI